MLKNIINLLKVDDFYNKDELIEIAKGKYKAPESLKEGYKNGKRRIKWQLKKQ